MFKTITLALSAAAVLSASTAFAAEDPENRIADRYPALEASVRQLPAMPFAFASAAPARVKQTSDDVLFERAKWAGGVF